MLGNIVSLLVATQNISLRTENFELVSISKCFVQYDSIVAYCGSFDSIHYGIDIVFDKNTPHQLTSEECATLQSTGVINFKGHRLETTKGKGHHTFDIVAEGKKGVEGECRGVPFVHKGRLFVQHVLRFVFPKNYIRLIQ